MQQGAQRRGSRQGQATQKGDKFTSAIGCFSDIFVKLEGILSTLQFNIDHANQGNAALDSLITGLKMLRTQFETGQPFKGADKDSFHNAVTMFTKINCDHILNGWYRHIPYDDHLTIFRGYVQKTKEILQLLDQIKNIVSTNKKYDVTLKKLFSDMTTHFRLFKLAYDLNVLNAMSHLLPKNPESATEIFYLLEAAKMEHSYLESRIPQMDAVNKLFTGYESFLKQNYYAMLCSLSECYVIDPTTKRLIDFINPKKLLQNLKANKDDNSLFQRLMLCIKMARRLSQLGSFELAWRYLDFYFQQIERYTQIRKGTHLAEIMVNTKESVITIANAIYEKLLTEFEKGHDFNIDYTNFKIISAIIDRIGRNEPNANSTTFQRLKKELMEKQLQREAEFKTLIHNFLFPFVELQVTDGKARFIFAKNVATKKLAQLLKQRGCKIKLKYQANKIYTKNLHAYPLKDIDVFCNTYAELIAPNAPEPNIEVLAEQFTSCALGDNFEDKETLTGREFLKQYPPKPVREKNKGVANPVIEQVEDKIAEIDSRLHPEKVARLFGEQFKDKKVYRCHMKSGIDSFYVCLDENEKNANDCTSFEREDFAKLFVDARQALNKKDFGFKISHVPATGEVTLCAKKGYLRAYPQTKQISQTDKSKILFLYNAIVKKDSRQEKHHVMQTLQPATSQPHKKKHPKKVKQKTKKR